MPGKHPDPAYQQVHAGHFGVTVTFNYPDGLRTLVASSRIAAFDLARGRWGEAWRGEPCVSSPWSIYKDLTGRTKMKHGADFYAHNRGVDRGRQAQRYREGRA